MFTCQIGNPQHLNELGRLRQADLLREVERDQLIQLARAGKPGLIGLCLAGIGDLLVALGTRLKRAHASA